MYIFLSIRVLLYPFAVRLCLPVAQATTDLFSISVSDFRFVSVFFLFFFFNARNQTQGFTMILITFISHSSPLYFSVFDQVSKGNISYNIHVLTLELMPGGWGGRRSRNLEFTLDSAPTASLLMLRDLMVC